MDRLLQHIESLIFVSDHAISLKEIKACLDETFSTKFKKEDVESSITQLIEKYQEESFAIEIVEISNGYRFMSKGSYHNTISTYLKQHNTKRLSKAALETLSIIAYKQPVIKSEVEQIRGVSCDYSIQKLLDKELVEIVGRSEGPGRPLLYATSGKFMDYFSLKSIDDLPKLKEIQTADNAIGSGEEDEAVALLPSTEEE